MKRKVMRLGEHSHVLSLPAEYTRRWNISKGDELQVVMDGPALHITSENLPNQSHVTLPEHEATSEHLMELYGNGFDVIHISGIPQHLLKDLPHLPFEILEVGKGYLTLQVTQEVTQRELPTTMRKIQYLCRQFSLPQMANVLKKHIQTCSRVLSKFGYKNRATMFLLYRFLWELEKALEGGNLREMVETIPNVLSRVE